MQSRSSILKFLIYTLLVFLSAVFLMPIVWVIFSSFKPAGELFTWPPTLLGRNPSLDNYTQAFAAGDFGRWFINTVVVRVLATVLTVIVNIMA